MDRNLILAIVISILIIITFQYYFQAFSPPPAEKPPASKEKPAGEGTVQEKTSPLPDKAAAKRHLEGKAPARAEEQPQAVPPVTETRIKVDGLKYEAVLSSKGARIVSFKLKDYKKTLKGDALVNMFKQGGPDSSGPSIILIRRDETLNDAGLAYDCESGDTSVSLKEKGEKKAVTFRTTTPGGLTIVKSYTFHADRYSVDFHVTLINESGNDRNYLITFPWKLVYKAGPGSGGLLGNSESRFSWDSAEILLNGELKDYYFTKIEGDEEPSGKVQWAGLGDIYFFKALVFGERPAKKVTLFKPSEEGIAEIRIRYGSADLSPRKPYEMPLSLYLGPKEHNALTASGHDLARAQFYSEYAILQIMSEYLMKFLRLCNTGFSLSGFKVPGTGNWGIDIIILTIVIKILFIPLTHKSMKSMKRMQEIQPQIAKLKEKLKDDKTALNKATMDLFREHKVNPLGGCWPMFLQLPVFIALYQALSYAIELRHASFVCIPSIYLCINDLSAPDPYYVTPILMGATMVLQQWMTPSGGDPMQRKMMLIMPVVFTYLFLSFPSGLVLYWLVSNVLSIGQQFLTNRMAK